MKVVTKCVTIENEKFYLIKDKAPDGATYYGTIPYNEVENGVLKRVLNGFDMSIGATIGEALARREKDIKILKAVTEYMAQGLSRQDAVLKAFGY